VESTLRYKVKQISDLCKIILIKKLQQDGLAEKKKVGFLCIAENAMLAPAIFVREGLLI